MKAFVLWGAGSLGAAQVGMLRALAEHLIVPDLIVGASVGALNAAHYAARPTPAGAEELARLWLSVGRHDVPTRTLLSQAPMPKTSDVLTTRAFVRTGLLKRLLTAWVCLARFDEFACWSEYPGPGFWC
ncbi:patatin-like phospholipase family protein [Nocardia sp. NPDC046763]|uniref:patatin-like phospholipase family protein n=1 Tax=Nocardia sp. NPDC046763 TaxID=3155256 RepID=UPI0033F975DC